MGAWGGWALAPDIADGEGLPLPHILVVTASPTFKIFGDFFDFFRGGSAALVDEFAAEIAAQRAIREVCGKLALPPLRTPLRSALRSRKRYCPRVLCLWPEYPYGVSTARLTIFSFCSFFNSAATSSLSFALLPNCSRNMPSLAPPTIEAW
jgi:hypothetical protein